jgi:chromatin segregation and condensation protein Rec8/ScpA/Scc1 (kleisin family)
MIERVLAALGSERATPFRAMVRDGADRHETLTAFLAVLVLIRRRSIVAHQPELFGEITLIPHAPALRSSESPDGLDDEFAADD